MNYRKTSLTFLAIVTVLSAGACGVRHKGVVYVGPRHPPYTGEVRVFFKEHGVPDPRTYKHIARVGGMDSSIGARAAAFSKELHDWIKTEAAKAGGNGVIISCGELGTEGQNTCYGDVILIK